MKRRKRAENPADRVARLRAERDARQWRRFVFVGAAVVPIVAAILLVARSDARRDALRREAQGDTWRAVVDEEMREADNWARVSGKPTSRERQAARDR